MTDEKAFDEAYKLLNAAQKKAVDTVEGPVLVIAGPGTGKTHILTLRIANILKLTQANPENILVLTFTESAARTVGTRLANYVGEETARKVEIYTFHSFAEELIKKHPEAFGNVSEQRLMGELEHTLLWRRVLSETAGIEELRTGKSPFFYLNELKRLEDDLVRECVSIEDYQAWIEEEARAIESDDSLRLTRKSSGGEVGDLSAVGKKQLARLTKARESVKLIESFRTLKEQEALYTYTDVLRMAVDTLRTDEALKADIQEQYQYVLADEHQDANALQHGLLNALAYDDYPNLFIVGDEKQGIFRFQGADSSHMSEFISAYPRTVVIPLTENYRSYQNILDASHGLLANLPSTLGEHVELSATRTGTASIRLLAAPDPLAEQDQVAGLIEAAIAAGTAPEEIAVITLRNATANLLAAHLMARGIKTLRAGDVAIEAVPSVRFLLALMNAVADPLALSALRECLLAPWWDEPLSERAYLLRTSRDRELRGALAEKFPRIAEVLTELQKRATDTCPLPLFSRLIGETGVRSYFLARAERVEEIPLLRLIIMHLEELAVRNPNASFADIMRDMELAREHDLGSMKTSRTREEGKVTVITAHKAKGMEFEKVFVAGLTAREWESTGKGSLIPSPLSQRRELEDSVKLLYVAMTRAKDELTLSYATQTADGRETPPTELVPSGLPLITPAYADIPVFHSSVNATELVRDLTLNYLTHEGLSPSAFNEYLESPARFFARRVLRLTEPETRPIAIGNAVHAGIAAYLGAHQEAVEVRKEKSDRALAGSLARSLLPRDEAFEELTRTAYQSVATYLASPLMSREPKAVEETFSLTRTVSGIPVLLRGKVDAVFAGANGDCVVDFKTSSNLGGKKEGFERQLAFYDLLLRASDYEPTEALIIQVGEEKVKENQIELSDATREVFKNELDTVLEELLSGTWRNGEPSDYDDLLKLFGED